MSGLPRYEDTQGEITACPLYDNIAYNEGQPFVQEQPGNQWQHSNSYHYPSLNSGSQARLQVSLPPAWPAECATLTNYRYQTVEDHYSLSEPVLLLDRRGRPLRPGRGRGGQADPFLQQRIGNFLDTQHPGGQENHVMPASPVGSTADYRAGGGVGIGGGGTTTYEEFTLQTDQDDLPRRRERTCAKGSFVVSLIVSAIALIVFLGIAVLKSVHLI